MGRLKMREMKMWYNIAVLEITGKLS